MPLSSPPLICLLSSAKDEDRARELERYFSVLVHQGALRFWSPRHIPAGHDFQHETLEKLSQADVILLLLSAEFLASGMPGYQQVLESSRVRKARIIPVLLRPTLLPRELQALAPLPRNARPITTHRNIDEAMLSVVTEVAALVKDQQTTPPQTSETAPPPSHKGTTASEQLTIDHIFRADGDPEYTFVEPEQLPRIQIELAAMGRGLIVEGPSKVGKSTAVRRALRELRQDDSMCQWLDGKLMPTKEELEARLRSMAAGQGPTHLIIDDFHRITDIPLRQLVADYMKVLADQSKPRSKITLIGINPLGTSLTDLLPDLEGRYWLIQMDRPQPDTKIAELITRGEERANVRFKLKDEIIREANGNFYIAQLLCREAALAVVKVIPDELVDILVGLGAILDAIVGQFRQTYHRPLCNFAAFDERVPPRGGCLALLWLLSHPSDDRDGHVSIERARLRYPSVEDHLKWLGSSNLRACFQQNPRLRDLLFYDRSAGRLSLEDPRLRFYLRRLDWDELSTASGHSGVRFNSNDGPIFPSRGDAAQVGIGVPRNPRESVVLHLSDLHFTRAQDDQAMRLYSPLAQDLRQQGCERLGAVIISGDIGTESVPDEYAAARQFLEMLMAGFGLSREQLVLVPGNHDVNWDLSRDAYTLQRRSRYKGELGEESFIAISDDVIDVRDEEAYKQRFRHFAAFYREVKGTEYPLEYEQQFTIHDLPAQGLCILGLNSAWSIDHHFRARAAINDRAMAHLVQSLATLPRTDRQRIAVWHHPLPSGDPDSIQDTGFMQLLAIEGFRLALHGHIHRADNQVYLYDRSVAGRRLTLVAAGTFGAPVRQWSSGYPLQYNLLRLMGQSAIIETRCRETPTGAWRPDARWMQGPNTDPQPRYTITL